MTATGNSAPPAAFLIALPSEQQDAESAAPAVSEVPSTGLSIGRKESCNLKLTCPMISAEQCRIRWNSHAAQYELEDRSSNGTYVNGFLTGKGRVRQLCAGDVVQLTKQGAVRGLRFRFAVATAATGLRPQLAAPPEEPPPTTVPATTVPGVPLLGHRKGVTERDASPPCGIVSGRVQRSPTCVNLQAAEGVQRQADAALLARSVGKQLGAEEVPADKTSAAALAAELAAMRQELTRLREAGNTPLGGKSAKADGSRAAQEEAAEEAEHARLLRQRGVLEAELADRQATVVQLSQKFKQRETRAKEEAAEGQRLQAELDAVVLGVVQERGNLEAYEIHIAEVQKCCDVAEGELGRLLDAKTKLEAALTAANEATKSVLATKEELEEKAGKKRSALARLETIAQDCILECKAAAAALEGEVRGSVNPQALSLDSCDVAFVEPPTSRTLGACHAVEAVGGQARRKVLADLNGGANPKATDKENSHDHPVAGTRPLNPVEAPSPPELLDLSDRGPPAKKSRVWARQLPGVAAAFVEHRRAIEDLCSPDG
mmetsp:Transcript_69264/g.129333  ORF Transcript_69264/g.129333 Transcript_69264/m.129333 type:complete len:546 (+) Transcript_69264:103-1740(+)